MLAFKPHPRKYFRYRQLCVLYLFGSAFSCYAEDVPQTCPSGSYANSSELPVECLPCRVCEPGQGVTKTCTGTNDTVCSECISGYFSKLQSNGRQCVQCDVCGPGRSEISRCTSDHNSVCGSCASGYFLYIMGSENECKRCSQCPTDRVMVHWIECAEAGLPQDHQCAPEEGSIGSLPTISLLLPTSHTVAKERSKLPSAHGTFIPMSSYKWKAEGTKDDTTAKTIAYVSIGFTAATFCAMLCAFLSLCVNCCERRKTHSHQLERITSKESIPEAHFPVQETSQPEESSSLHSIGEKPTTSTAQREAKVSIEESSDIKRVYKERLLRTRRVNSATCTQHTHRLAETAIVASTSTSEDPKRFVGEEPSGIAVQESSTT